MTPKDQRSERRSTAKPRACSGDMYAKVPRMRPASVEGIDNVGAFKVIDAPDNSTAFANPKSSTFTVPSAATLMFAGFRSRWMTPCSCADSDRFGDLPRDRKCFVKRQRSARDALREILAVDELHKRSPMSPEYGVTYVSGHLRGFSDQPVAEIVQCGEPTRRIRGPRPVLSGIASRLRLTANGIESSPRSHSIACEIPRHR